MRGRAVWLAAGVAAVFLAHAFWLAGVAEDAFISFRFARNLVAGHGLVWNPGEAPVGALASLPVFYVDPDLIQRQAPRILEGARIVCAALDSVRGRK